MNHKTGWGLLLVAILFVGALAGVSAADETVTEIDADHELATEEQIQSYHAADVASGEADDIQLTLTVASDRDDVGLEDDFNPLDLRNEYLRLEYDEQISRTIRVFIPAEMITPYTREGVESLTTTHTASFEPIRDGEYLAVVIHFDGPADVVLPLDRSAATSYGLLDRAEERVERVTGVSLSGDEEWTYADEELENHTVLELEADPDDIEIQYDARHGEVEELWVSAPEGDDPRAGVYWYYSESDDLVTVVPKGEDPPTVRYKTEATLRDQLDGAVNDARQTLDRVRDAVPMPWTSEEGPLL